MIKLKKTREVGNKMGMEEKIEAHKNLVGRPLGIDGQRSRIILKWI
jgi:hypothetical protein